MKSLVTATLVVVFLLSGLLTGQEHTPEKIPGKVEYVHSFSIPHGSHSINYADLYHQFGRVAISGDVYGLHHGTLAAVSITVPLRRWKGLMLSPGVVAVFGPYETGPGGVVRWEYDKGIFSSEGTAGLFHPVKDGKFLHFLGDPIDLDVRPFQKNHRSWVRELKIGYSGEFGRYGKYGLHTDRIHSVQFKASPNSPMSKFMRNHVTRRDTNIIFSYVPEGHIVRTGISFDPFTHKEKH